MLNSPIVSDDSFKSKVTKNNTIQIDDGTKSSDDLNLFHSFKDFSVPEDQTAYFNNNTNIKNIFVCITGNAVTNIDGTIRANGDVNIYFMNSNGIILDKNAALEDVGSFLATTAEKIVFAGGAEFNIKDLSVAPLSAVGDPVRLVTGENAGSISVKSSSLQVSNGKTLALVGNRLSLDDSSNLLAEDGTIAMVSVNFNSFVTIETITDSWIFSYSDANKWQDINLNSSKIEANSIKIQGKEVTLAGTSKIIGKSKVNNPIRLSIDVENITVTDSGQIGVEGSSEKDILEINAAEYIELNALSRDVGIYNNPKDENPEANVGNIDIATKQLFIKNGAQINASVFSGSGNAGTIDIKASESVELSGRFLDSNNPLDRANEIPSGLFVSIDGDSTGKAGNINLETEILTIRDGAQICNYAMKGSSGRLDIKATESILISGTSPTTAFDMKSGIYASVSEGAGTVGTIVITTKSLTVEELATVSANNFGTGKGGEIILNVDDLVVSNSGYIEAGTFANGGGGILKIDAKSSIKVFGIKNTFFINLDGTTSPIVIESKLSTRSGIELDGLNGKGKAGNLEILTPHLTVMDGAQIRTDSVSSFSAGDISLDAEKIVLSDNSIITASAKAGKGGNINIITATEGLSASDKITAFGQNNDPKFNGDIIITPSQKENVLS